MFGKAGLAFAIALLACVASANGHAEDTAKIAALTNAEQKSISSIRESRGYSSPSAAALGAASAIAGSAVGSGVAADMSLVAVSIPAFARSENSRISGSWQK